MQETIVIGAGIAGIASSIRLAKKGHRVNVYEANDYPGGKLSVIEQDGFRWDAGPSLFTLPHLVTELFELCGEDPKLHFQYDRHPTSCVYYWEDGTRYVLPGIRSEIAPSMASTFRVSADRVDRYLKKAKRKYELTGPVFLEQSLHLRKSYTSWSTLKTLMQSGGLGIFSSLHKENERYFEDERLVQLFDRYATYNGSSPYRTPGIMSMIPHLEMGIGTFFPQGGMYAITQSLVALAKRQGVQFHFGQRVDRIDVKDGRACGILLNGESIPADFVLSNMDVFATYRRLLAEQTQPEKILQQERSSSALIFYWGVQGDFPKLDLHNIFFSGNYKEEFKTLFEHKSIYDDPTVYVNISSKCQAGDAPEGHENWFVMINAPGDFGQDWEVLIDCVREQVKDKLSRMMGVDLNDRIVSEAILDPRTIESRTQSHLGALYGTASNSRFAAFWRHANFSKRIDNLYFCGGSVHPGGGIPLCLHSAAIATKMIPEG
ncbi:MAG: 1-hydroxycarotenoid 3,4-desaturase CrtD [Bacteroidota bacterium]